MNKKYIYTYLNLKIFCCIQTTMYKIIYKDILYKQGIQSIFYNYKWNITFKIVNHYVVYLKLIVHQLHLNKKKIFCC